MLLHVQSGPNMVRRVYSSPSKRNPLCGGLALKAVAIEVLMHCLMIMYRFPARSGAQQDVRFSSYRRCVFQEPPPQKTLGRHIGNSWENGTNSTSVVHLGDARVYGAICYTNRGCQVGALSPQTSRQTVELAQYQVCINIIMNSCLLLDCLIA